MFVRPEATSDLGRIADRSGRARLIPAGVGLGAVCALLLAVPLPLIAVETAISTWSLAYDMIQPPLGGIVTTLSSNRGQAMGVNVCTLFTGFGLGSRIFQALLTAGFAVAFGVFGATALIATVLVISLFRDERPSTVAQTPA